MSPKTVFTLIAGFFLLHSLQAQENLRPYTIQVAYELDFQQDSTRETRKQETMFLFINNGNSLFESANEYYNDSLRYKKETAGGNVSTGDYWSEFQFRIYKSSDSKMQIFDVVTIDDESYFTYPEDKSAMNWKIQPDTATIGGFPVQKAITDFGGRTWIAWFTSEVPISDGPYKFCGLPGLIVQISDTDDQYKFSLMSILQQEYDVYTPHVRKPIKTTKKQYFKAVERYRSNPFGYAQQSGVVYTSGQDEIKKNLEIFVKQRNNPIELVP